MKHLKSTKKSKYTHTRPLPIGKKSRGVLAVYAAVVFTVCCLPLTAFAAGNDPLAVINNLSDFIFGVIRAVGLILLGWGIVQIGLSFQSHDPSQRSNGFLTLAGGVVVTFAMDLGRQLKTMGLLIITDAMLNRVTENWRKGKRTHLFIDEFHVVFQNPYSADFFDSAWRRFRKRGAYPTAITQNVEYLLDSVQASTMLSNSEMLILLNQAPSDREKLAALLNISPEQTGYITNAPAGSGLLRYGGALVPFKNQFPKDTELYRLMTTKPDESIIVGSNTK